jgi:hypothetical protein
MSRHLVYRKANIYQFDKVVIRLDYALTPTQAKEYGTAFNEVLAKL